MIKFTSRPNGTDIDGPARQIQRLAEQHANYSLPSDTLLDMAKVATKKIVEKLQGEASLLDNPFHLINTFRDKTFQLIEAERPHRARLEELAVRIVKEHFGITRSMTIQLRGSIVDFKREPFGTAPGRHTITDDIRGAVVKRRLTNAIVQGGSSSLDQLPYLDRKEIDAVSPSLFKQQMDQHNLANAQFFAFNDVLLETPPGKHFHPAAGLVRVSHVGGVVHVEANAVTFTLLVHELAKGVLERLALGGREQDDEKRKEVEHIADDPRLEGLDIFLGRELWLRLCRSSDLQGIPFYQDLQRLFELEPTQFVAEVRRRATPSSR